MKKLIIILFSVFFLYFVNWSLLPYYSRPEIRWDGGISDEEKKEVLHFVEDSLNIVKPVKFDGANAVKRMFVPNQRVKKIIDIKKRYEGRYIVKVILRYGSSHHEFEANSVAIEKDPDRGHYKVLWREVST